MTTEVSEANAGDFTVTCSLVSDAAEFYTVTETNDTPKPVVLSFNQESPTTYVLLNGNKTVVQKPSNAVWTAKYAVSITVTYNGTTSIAREVAAQWQTAITGKDLKITTTASGGLASVVRYVASASNLTGNAANAIKTVAHDTAAAYTFSGASGSWTSGSKNLGYIYVALTGSDSDQDELLSAAATVLTPAFSLVDTPVEP